MEDPWKVLGLPRGATKLEVKEAYMKLAQQLHPDKNMDLNHEQRLISEARFKTVQHAYNYLSGKERFTQIHVPARWAEAEAAAAAEMQKAVFTNRQAALWVTGVCFLGASFMCAWSLAQWRMRDLSNQETKQISARQKYIDQAKKWDRNLSTDELRHMMDERRDLSIQRAVNEGVKGAATYAAAAGVILGTLKGFQLAGIRKGLFKPPLVSFHLRPPAICFYVASAGVYGFYDWGLNTLSHKGRLHKFVGVDEPQDE